MKTMKKITALLLTMVLCCTVAACGGAEGGSQSAVNSGETLYQVTVADALGNPYASGVVVKFMQNGQQAAMQVPNESGVAEKSLPSGEYTVELQFTGDAQYVYDASALTLTAEKPAVTVELCYALSQQTMTLGVQGEAVEAPYIQNGCTRISLNSAGRSYFLYTPTEAGLFEFSLVGSDAAIGYYGMPHYVQETSAVEVVDNKFSMSIRSTMIGQGQGGTSVMVIGVDAGEGDAVLCINRLGDPEWSVEDEPWSVYAPTVELSPYSLPAGSQLQEFDLSAATDAYNLVLGADGYYHLNSADGPLVLMKLGKTGGEDKYVDCFEIILEYTGVVRYFFNDDGQFQKKENYTDCLLKYIENVDEASGMYPLTEDLKYILQQEGEDSGWWTPGAPLYLFLDENGEPLSGINHDIAWLFMCRYMA